MQLIFASIKQSCRVVIHLLTPSLPASCYKVVVTRFCDRAPEVPPPSLYFAYGGTQRLYNELVSEDPGLYTSQHSSELDGNGDSGAESGGESDTYDEKVVDLRQHESRPGRVYSDVDPAMASFIVAR
jgi:hypothetical protein